MRTWGRQEADIKILEILDQFIYLRAKTILVKTGFKNSKRGYERLSELRRMGYIESQSYVRPVNIGSKSNPIIIPKKVAAIYSLTSKGVQILKEIHGEFVEGTERGNYLNPEDSEKLELIYRQSLILEALSNIDFKPGRVWKQEQELNNFIKADLVYKNQVLIFERSQTNADRNTIKSHCENLLADKKTKNVIILTRNLRSRNALARWQARNYGGRERIITEKEHTEIRAVLKNDIIPTAENYLSHRGYNITKLQKPKDGCLYIIDGEPSNIYDFVGTPIRPLRVTARNPIGKSYIIVGTQPEGNFISKQYPQLLDNGEILTLAELKDVIQPKPTQVTDTWIEGELFS